MRHPDNKQWNSDYLLKEINVQKNTGKRIKGLNGPFLLTLNMLFIHFIQHHQKNKEEKP